jgi:hypothetical protein
VYCTEENLATLHETGELESFEGQGCQMVSFQTKNSKLGKFWRALDGKMLVYFGAIWNIIRAFGIFYDHLVRFGSIWYIFSWSQSYDRELQRQRCKFLQPHV